MVEDADMLADIAISIKQGAGKRYERINSLKNHCVRVNAKKKER